MEAKVIDSKTLRRLVYYYGPWHEYRDTVWSDEEHTWVATGTKYTRDTDICDLFGAICKALLNISMLMLMLSVAAFVLGDLGAWVLAAVQAHHWIEVGPGFVVVSVMLAMIAFLAVIMGIYYGGNWLIKKIDERRGRKAVASGVNYMTIGDAWKAWREKYCFKLEIR
jgi:hypothetical protein